MKHKLLLIAAGLAAFVIVFAATKAVNSPRAPRVADDAVVKAMPAQPRANAVPGMVWIPGGEFTMGTDADMGWPEEKPAHRVNVDGFLIDETEVANSQFDAFVKATGYITTAEQTPSIEEILAQAPPGTPPPPKESLVPGSLVFTMTTEAVDLQDYAQWWKWTPGANWRHPEGPQSDLKGREQHPVVHVSWDDAVAYAKWTGKRLPTEAEWELAARGGLIDKPYVWGDDAPSDTQVFANLWQGNFPYKNTEADGYTRTAPVKSFKPNGFGLYDMPGNVWEWCADAYDSGAYKRRAGRDVVVNPLGERSVDPRNPRAASKAQRGGSFLCNDEYCSRYRPSARHGLSSDTGMSHVGFRCAKSL